MERDTARDAREALVSLETLESAVRLGQRLGVSDESIRRWWRLGVIPGHKLGRLLRFSPAEVYEALARAAEAQARQA